MKPAIVALALATALVAVAPSPQGIAATPACDRQIVMQIDSAMISHTPDGIQINAYGVAESAGWKNPVLVLAGRSGNTAHVDFVACRPEVSAQVLTPIQTQQVLDVGPATARIVIRAKTNAMTVEITR